MRITKAKIFRKDLPLKVSFEHASSGKISHIEEIYLRLDTDSGHYGYGEIRGNCEYVSGETTESIIPSIRKILFPKLLGMDPLNINICSKTINSSVMRNYAAKALCDIAIHDLASKIWGVPLWQLLGGKLKSYLPTEKNIPFCSLEETRQLANEYLEDGCRFIKIRVGLDFFEEDVQRIKAVNETISQKGLQKKDILLGIDANQAWDVKEAISNINHLAQLGISLVEQPIPAGDIAKFKQVKDGCSLKIIADESVFSLDDLSRHISEKAIDGFHLKLMECGGISNAVKMIHMAEGHGIECMVGGMDEGALAVAAAVHCGAITDTTLYELHNNSRIEEDPATGLIIENNVVQVPDKPGIGVELNEQSLELVYEEIYK